MPVIDLGDRREPAAPARRIRLARVRPAVALALAVLTGAVLTASGVRLAPALRRLWSAQVGNGLVDIGADTVYVRDGQSQTVLVAFDAGTGRVRWRVDLGSPPVSVTENGLGQAVIFTGTARGLGFPKTMSVDVDGGGVLNEHLGRPVGLAQGGRLALVYNEAVLEALTGRLDITGFRMVGGGSAWQVSVANSHQYWIDSDDAGMARWVFTMTPDGGGTVWDIDSGQRVAEGALASPAATRVGPPPALGAAAVRDHLVLAEHVSAGLSVRGYALPDLRPVWSATLRPVGDGEFVIGSCATFVCLRRAGGTAVLDPATGRELIELDGAVVGHQTGIVTAVRVARGGGETVAYDAGTGRLVRAYPGWVLTDWPASHGVPVYRPGRDRTTFAQLSEAGYLRPLGEVPGENLDCQARGALLACLDPGGRLSVWRLT